MKNLATVMDVDKEKVEGSERRDDGAGISLNDSTTSTTKSNEMGSSRNAPQAPISTHENTSTQNEANPLNESSIVDGPPKHHGTNRNIENGERSYTPPKPTSVSTIQETPSNKPNDNVDITDDSEKSSDDPVDIPSSCPNSHLETLNRIRRVLQNYDPNDDLDQDTIVSTILKMNKSSYERHSRKAYIDKYKGWTDNFGHDEMCWDDDDLLPDAKGNGPGNQHGKPNFLHALVNVVDADFFYDIIDQVEASTTDFLLNQDVIHSIRDSLAIHDDGKKRKRRDIRLTSAPRAQLAGGNGDEPKIGGSASTYLVDQPATTETGEIISDGRRRTRGMTRVSRNKGVTDENELLENGGLETLLSTMIELEKAAGRPSNLVENIRQPRKLRTRPPKPQQKQQIETVVTEEKEEEEDRTIKLFDQKGREITKIIVGGEILATPKRRGPKRKRPIIKEVSTIQSFIIFFSTLCVSKLVSNHTLFRLRRNGRKKTR
jgi:hypothetical protein